MNAIPIIAIILGTFVGGYVGYLIEPLWLAMLVSGVLGYSIGRAGYYLVRYLYG